MRLERFNSVLTLLMFPLTISGFSLRGTFLLPATER
jgi:hypothetical protein